MKLTPRNNIVVDPYLNEFVYELLYSSTREQRQNIPAKYNKIFNSSAKAQSFSVRSSIELKQLVLSFLGINWFMVFADKDVLPKDMRDIMSLYRKGKNSEALKKIVDKRIYVYSDKQFIDMLGIMADNEHHPAYSMGIDLKKTGYHIRKWKKRMSIQDQSDSIENKEAMESLINMIISYESVAEVSDSLLGMNEADLKVLLFFYQKRHTYASDEAAFEAFRGAITKSSISRSIRRCRDHLFLQITQMNKGREYTITALGINQINKFAKEMLKRFNYA